MSTSHKVSTTTHSGGVTASARRLALTGALAGGVGILIGLCFCSALHDQVDAADLPFEADSFSILRAHASEDVEFLKDPEVFALGVVLDSPAIDATLKDQKFMRIAEPPLSTGPPWFARLVNAEWDGFQSPAHEGVVTYVWISPDKRLVAVRVFPF